MENPKEQLVSRLKEANNVLVTVSANPSVDQLAAAIGLTLFLTKLKKHSTAVFSGEVPSTIEFLKPEETIEGNTDSLQDFIIALDKNKADKIRYKVEDQMVKIFITPYRTSIGQDDLVFSKGDFNVDVVVALGVHKKEDLDQAITAHGRILHDATVSTINTQESSELGSLNWTDKAASSLCEMVVVLTDSLKPNSFDAQMATALLTGIVAETERFSNAKTTSNTMNASAKLMAAGANQQLVASKLEEAPPEITPVSEAKGPEAAPAEEGGTVVEDGSLVIHHEEKPKAEKAEAAAKPEPAEAPPEPPKPEPKKPEPAPKPKPEPAPEPAPEKPKKEVEEIREEPVKEAEPPQVRISEDGELKSLKPHETDIHIKPEHREFLATPPTSQHHDDTVVGGPAGESLLSGPPTSSHFITQPPSMGGKLSAAADDFDSDTNPLSLPPVDPPILSHESDKNHSKPKDSPPDEPPDVPPPLPPPPPPPPPPEPKAPTEPSSPVITPAEKKRETPPSSHLKKKAHTSKLPESFIKVLDDRTLKELEHRTHSPHETQIVDEVKGKTLQGIEEVVHSPHQINPLHPHEPQKTAEATTVKKNEPLFKGPALEYEPHESEPPARDISEHKESGGILPPTTPAPEEKGKSVFSAPPSSLRGLTKKASLGSDDEDDTGPKNASTDAATARDAVLKAINTGGDGRTSLPRMESISSTDVGLDLGHSAPAPAHPVASAPPKPQEPSPHIHIDEEGTVTFRDEPVVEAVTPKPLRTTPDMDDQDTNHGHAQSTSPPPPPGPPPMMPPHLTTKPSVG